MTVSLKMSLFIVQENKNLKKPKETQTHNAIDLKMSAVKNSIFFC